jgi:Domain of unknown function (DUF4293)
MLQRIQTIWLLLASVCAFLTLKLPFYSGTNAKAIASYPLNGAETILLLSITIALGLLSLFTLFLFKNRVLQLRLCILGIIIEAILLFLYFKQVQTFTVGTYSLTALLHGFIILFLLLAARSINKDEKMVKSSDRLR